MESRRIGGANLESVYWIGGSFSGGKSTTCRLLVDEFTCQPFHYDRHLLNDPVFEEFKIRDELWFWLPIERKLERYRSVFQTAVAQIAELAANGPVIVEGPGLLPELLAQHQVQSSRVLYLLPTPSHQRSANRRRGDWVGEVLANVDDPEVAWELWMKLDEEFASLLSRYTSDRKYRVRWNDGARKPLEIARIVAQHFHL